METCRKIGGNGRADRCTQAVQRADSDRLSLPLRGQFVISDLLIPDPPSAEIEQFPCAEGSGAELAAPGCV